MDALRLSMFGEIDILRQDKEQYFTTEYAQ